MRFVLSALILATAACSSAPKRSGELTGVPVRQAGRAALEPMPIYVTPYYNSKGPMVNVGSFSQGLATTDADRLAETIRAMKKQFSTLPAEAMFVAAIRLYDQGARDEAVYWFYSAQYRAKVFQAVVDGRTPGGLGSEAFERRQAHGAFRELAGTFINGYAGCDVDRWARTIEDVARDGRTVPDLTRIYPRVGFLPRKHWAAKNAEIGTGLSKFAEYLRTHQDEIKSIRAKNGMDERSCR
jgi:hypothetical protein